MNLTKETLESEKQGFSVRLPVKFHNEIKAEAARQGLTKDEMMFNLLKKGIENYIKAS